MRILVVSDIHANPAALAAVAAAEAGPFDARFCLGDIVEYGPDPAPCVDWVRANCTAVVRGNHDHGAAQNVDTQGVSGFRYLTMVSRRSTTARLADADRRYLAGLPTTRLLRVAGKSFFLVHASPRDPMDEYVPAEPVAWADRLAGLPVDYLLVGHTHVPLTLSVGRTTVVNPGSVGLGRDGNPHARYAVIDDAGVTLKEVPYDVAATVAAVHASDLEPLAKQMLADVYTHGRYVHPPDLPHPHSGANGHAQGNGRPSGGYAPVVLTVAPPRAG